MLTGLNLSVILLYTGIVVTLAMLVISSVDHLINSTEILTFSYSAKQYGYMLFTNICNFGDSYFLVSACHHDSPAFLQIFVYSIIVYAFFADYFIFDLPIEGSF